MFKFAATVTGAMELKIQEKNKVRLRKIDRWKNSAQARLEKWRARLIFLVRFSVCCLLLLHFA